MTLWDHVTSHDIICGHVTMWDHVTSHVTPVGSCGIILCYRVASLCSEQLYSSSILPAPNGRQLGVQLSISHHLNALVVQCWCSSIN